MSWLNLNEQSQLRLVAINRVCQASLLIQTFNQVGAVYLDFYKSKKKRKLQVETTHCLVNENVGVLCEKSWPVCKIQKNVCLKKNFFVF